MTASVQINSTLLVIQGDGAGRVEKIARFAGLKPAVCEAGALAHVHCALISEPKSKAAVLNCDTASQLFASGQAGLLDAFANVLIYGWGDPKQAQDLLERIGGPGIRAEAARPLSDSKISVLEDAAFGAHLSGQTFAARRGCPGMRFSLPAREGRWRPLVLCDGEALVVKVQHRGATFVLWGTGEVADLDAPEANEHGPLDAFSRLMPLLMFLRQALPEEVWRSPRVEGNLMIDDPMLQPQYGCLNFAGLLGSMDRCGYSASVAFIPWNYRRTKPATAALFKARRDRFSICVHGCDHTKGEFSTGTEERFDFLSTDAMRRMDEHRRLTGLEFDPVMVFPQGRFSARAMKALSHSRFVAAINSTWFATDCPSMPLRDLLQPVCRFYSAFPLFLRRYPEPENLANIAFDLFLGRPLFLVEHHDYFREGFERMDAFLEKVRELEPNVQWSTPASICSQFHQRRRSQSGRLEIRFYTGILSIANASDD